MKTQVFICLVVSAAALKAQTAWFVDGYHGGVYGHYPPGYTGFLAVFANAGQIADRTLINSPSGWEVPAMFERDGALVVRLFNASGDETTQRIAFGFEAGKIELVELDGRTVEELRSEDGEGGTRTIRLSMPRFGIRTLRFGSLRAQENQ